ncbi:MAG TPA: hypothetical protein VFS43_16405 [Polyangiaceae bacterium]|nr:hypothetical protein [Polyangiaceae bacterium]
MNPRPAPDPRVERLVSAAWRYVPLGLAVGLLAQRTTATILARNGGEPGVPLDDAYIHFQYARSLAEGRFYAFMPGEGYTSGATSLLWPAALAPFYLLGLRDTSIVWAAWALGWFFFALLVAEVMRLAERLVGRATALGAAAATLGFGGYTWFAASGMEVTPLAWALAYTARLASEWHEGPERRAWPLRQRLLVMAFVGPLVRPEGTLCSLMAAAALALFAPPVAGPSPGARQEPSPPAPLPGERGREAGGAGGRRGWLARAFALAALAGPLVPPLINRALTGQFATTTTIVKWLPPNPYYGGANLWVTVRANLDTFVRVLLDGREWSAIFVPAGSQPVALAAFCCIPYAGYRGRAPFRALLVLGLAASMALPTTYLSFLWNRLRYLWPFAFAWCIGLACLARALADAAASVRPRWASAAPLVAGALAGLLAHHLPWSMDDVATSAYAIHNQQVELGRWAAESLPASARIGVNDTGAIAYLSGRRTFDVVGLTTPREARYWVAGAGSRFEHYERLEAESPSVLPTHFIVYPHWMSLDAVLGRELTRATVTDQTILGGTTMVAYEARYDLLHTGARPLGPDAALAPLDELDVADLESEAAHAYDAPEGGGTEADNLAHVYEAGERRAADGGRGKRLYDGFTLRAGVGPLRLVARLGAPQGARLRVATGGGAVAELEVPRGAWNELSVALPPASGAGERRVEVESTDGRRFVSMHYWAYDAGAAPPEPAAPPPGGRAGPSH